MSSSLGRSPAVALVFGLAVTLLAVVAYSAYVGRQISGLRDLQNNLIDRNRRDSIALLRIQGDLNSLGLAMRDMLDNAEPYPLTAWAAQFHRIRTDLDAAVKLEQDLSPAQRAPEQKEVLAGEIAQFWDAADRIFSLAQDGHPDEARARIRLSLQARQQALASAVARLLVQNNQSEEQAGEQVGAIYTRVQRQGYFFLAATLVAILLTGIYLISSNRRLFTQLAALSESRSELAQRLITTQESTLRYLSRELHDEFGQILTALGSLLGRSERHAPEGSPLRAELHEVRDMAQAALENVRSLSQALHPVMIEGVGLEGTIDWYLPVVEKQTGMKIHYEKSGDPYEVRGTAAIHIYRILQEALNNVARHANTAEAWVRLRYSGSALDMEVEDGGAGLPARSAKPGIGMVAMRERAELLGGMVEFSRPAQGGTRVCLRVPAEKLTSDDPQD